MILKSVDDLVDIGLNPWQIRLNQHSLPQVDQLSSLLLFIKGIVHEEYVLVLSILADGWEHQRLLQRFVLQVDFI